jgi:Zn-dependent protease with chaperone function/uncharacterized tellurite resistance protein B-like protein
MPESQLSQDLAGLRFDGDAKDAATLLGEYGAAEAISVLEQEHRLHGKLPWDESLAEAIPLSPALTPGIHSLITDACARLGLTCSIQLFTLPAPQINAYAFLDRNPDQPVLSLCLTSRTLEHLSDPELLFLIGHELGHIVYEHDRLNILCHTADNTSATTVLPAMGEWIFLRWRQKAEISADRIGWLLTGHFEDGGGAIVKSATGLTGRNLVLNAESILSFLNEGVPRPCIRDWNRQRAPLLSARLRALRILADSAPSKVRCANKRPAWLTKADKETEQILAALSRRPDSSLELACMHLLADAGVQLVQRDRTVAPDEIKKVLYILHDHFTDEPDQVICLDPLKRAYRLKSSIRVLNRTAPSTEKKEVLSRLADIATADGPFREEEAKVILDLATALKIPQQETYAIIVGCIQAAGKEVDPGVQSLADRLASPSAGM